MKRIGLSVLAVIGAAAGLSGPVFADEAPVLGKDSYAQMLLDRTLSAYPDVAGITIYARPAGAPAEVAVATNDGKVGAAVPAGIARAAQSGRASFAFDKKAGQLHGDLPLPDMSHKPAGILSLNLRAAPGKSIAALKAEAAAIRDGLARRISYTRNLFQTAHLDPNVPVNSYAQHLVDAALIAHPDVLILAIHATTPKNADPEILASNIGRIGKKADEDDMRVVKKGTTNLEVNTDLMRYEVELPLNDVSGTQIGALGVVYPYDAKTDKAARHKEAIAIRDAISRRILKPANLVEPYPYDSNYTDNTYAQKLVDQTFAAHPELLVLALHVTPPNGKTNIILASTIGRIGKKADSDDMGVVNTGVPNLELNKNGIRFEVELPLSDATGRKVGAVSMVFPYKAGDDKEMFHRKGLRLSAEIAKKIPDVAALFKPRT